MAGLEFHRMPEDAFRLTAPCAAAETFVVGDPVRIDTQQLVHGVDDGAIMEDADAVGFACEPATGITAGSRATNAADGFGVVTDQQRTYVPWTAPGLLMRTRNFWGAGAAGTPAVPDAANIGQIYGVSSANLAQNYGVEESAAALGTNACAVVIDVLDAEMRPINESGGAGVWVVFRPTATSTQDMAGE